jgi:hypothetical protein
MHFNFKKISLIILGITALVCSRALFALFNDPEGPNLLIVVGMAVILYALSLAVYLFVTSMKNPQRLVLAILIQIIIASGFYLALG